MTTAPTGTEPGPATVERRPTLALRDIVLMVVLGTVFGFPYWALVQAWTALSIAMGPAGDLAQHFLLGGWLLVAPLAAAIIRQPFVGILAEVIASVIEVVFLGSPVGPPLLVAAANPTRSPMSLSMSVCCSSARQRSPWLAPRRTIRWRKAWPPAT